MKIPERIFLTLAICLCSVLDAQCQNHYVKGVITNSMKESLAGTNVIIKGTTRGSISDQQGKFNVFAKPDHVLVFSYLGYLTQEVKVGDKKVIDVILKTKGAEKDDFNDAKNQNTGKAWLDYITSYYPDGKLLDKARKKSDDLVWNHLVSNQDFESIGIYQKYFTQGIHSNDIEPTKETIANENLKVTRESNGTTKDKIAAFRKYISQHSGANKQVETAQNELSSLIALI